MTLTEVGKQDLQSWRAYHLSERIGQSAYMSTEPRRLLMRELVNLPGPFSFGGTDDLLLRIGRSSRPIQPGKKLVVSTPGPRPKEHQTKYIETTFKPLVGF